MPPKKFVPLGQILDTPPTESLPPANRTQPALIPASILEQEPAERWYGTRNAKRPFLANRSTSLSSTTPSPSPGNSPSIQLLDNSKIKSTTSSTLPKPTVLSKTRSTSNSTAPHSLRTSKERKPSTATSERSVRQVKNHSITESPKPMETPSSYVQTLKEEGSGASLDAASKYFGISSAGNWVTLYGPDGTLFPSYRREQGAIVALSLIEGPPPIASGSSMSIRERLLSWSRNGARNPDRFVLKYKEGDQEKWEYKGYPYGDLAYDISLLDDTLAQLQELIPYERVNSIPFKVLQLNILRTYIVSGADSRSILEQTELTLVQRVLRGLRHVYKRVDQHRGQGILSPVSTSVEDLEYREMINSVSPSRALSLSVARAQSRPENPDKVPSPRRQVSRSSMSAQNSASGSEAQSGICHSSPTSNTLALEFSPLQEERSELPAATESKYKRLSLVDRLPSNDPKGENHNEPVQVFSNTATWTTMESSIEATPSAPRNFYNDPPRGIPTTTSSSIPVRLTSPGDSSSSYYVRNRLMHNVSEGIAALPTESIPTYNRPRHSFRNEERERETRNQQEDIWNEPVLSEGAAAPSTSRPNSNRGVAFSPFTPQPLRPLSRPTFNREATRRMARGTEKSSPEDGGSDKESHTRNKPAHAGESSNGRGRANSEEQGRLPTPLIPREGKGRESDLNRSPTRNYPQGGSGGGGGGGGGGDGGDGGGGGGGGGIPTQFPRNDNSTPQPARNVIPVIDNRFKLSDFPVLKKRDDVPKWLEKMARFTSIHPSFAKQIAEYIPEHKLEGEAEDWYAMLTTPAKEYMKQSWEHFVATLMDHFLGEAWIAEQNIVYNAQRFRQKDHEEETPSQFFLHRIRLSRILYGLIGKDEVLNVCMTMPVGWDVWIRKGELSSVDQLIQRVKDHESSLTANASYYTRMTNLNSDLRNLKTAFVKSVKPSFRKTAYIGTTAPEEEFDSRELDDIIEEIASEGIESHAFIAASQERRSGPSTNPRKFNSSFNNRRARSTTSKPIYPPADHVVSQRLPPSPCLGCGSAKHWDNDCPQYKEWKPKMVAAASSEPEVGRAMGEALEYDSLHVDYLVESMNGAEVTVKRALIADTGMEYPLADYLHRKGQDRLLPFFLSEEFTGLNHLPDTGEDNQKKLSLLKEYDSLFLKEGRQEETSQEETSEAEDSQEQINPKEGKPRVKIKPTRPKATAFYPRVEEVEDEDVTSWKQRDPRAYGSLADPILEERSPAELPIPSVKPSSHGKSFIPRKRATTKRSANRVSTSKETEDSSTDVHQPRKARELPDGMQNVGITALQVKARIGSARADEEEVKLDSGADISVISMERYEQLNPKPPLRSGLKLEVHGIHSKSRIVGYIKFPLWMKARDGMDIKTEVEAYVVPDMKVPILLGEDFMHSYEICVFRTQEESFIHFGLPKEAGGKHPMDVLVSSINGRGPAVAYRIESKKNKLPPFAQPKKREKKPTPPESEKVPKPSYVRTAERVVLKPHHFQNVKVDGPFEGSEEWILEKAWLAHGDSSAVAPPATLFASSNPIVPLANLSNKRRIIPAGTIIGTLHDPQKYLDSPTTEGKLNAMSKYAGLIQSMISARLSSPKSQETENVSSEVDAESTSPEETWDPKTADVPPVESIPSSKLWEALDVNQDSPEDFREALKKLVAKHADAFSLDDRLGHYPTKVHIRTRDGQVPISLPMYQASPAKKEVIDAQLKLWFKQDVIEPSKSPWAAPVVIVYRNDKARFCVDYRKLNVATIADEHPIPRQSEIMQALSGAQVMSTMDALSGFTQLEMAEEDREKTAFRTHRGLFQFKRMPFGLRNGPAIFQRVMQAILSPYLWLFALVYIDDIVVYSKSWEEHLEHLDAVLGAIREAGITLSPKKCHLGYTSILLLGQKVSRLGLSTHDEKVAAISELATPSKVSELQTFLGMVLYFSQYIAFYSELVAPLFALLRKGTKWEWKAEHEEAFRDVKKALQEAPVLGHPIPNRPYRLYTDASDTAIGCCLQQVQPIKVRDLRGTKIYERLRRSYQSNEPPPSLVHPLSARTNDCTESVSWSRPEWEDTEVLVERVICYWSRLLKSPERNYSATEREALGAKEGLVRFLPFIEGETVLLITDHAALQWARTYENANRRLAAWGTVFNAFPKLEIIHRAGRVHSNVDPLSRLRRTPPTYISPTTVKDATVAIQSANPERISHYTAEDRPPPAKITFYTSIERAFKPRREILAITRSAGKSATHENPKREEVEKRDEDTRPKRPPQSNITSQCIAMDADWLKKFLLGYKEDPELWKIWKEADQEKNTRFQSCRFYKGQDGLLFFRDGDFNPRLCVPRDLRIEMLKDMHESPMETAHAGPHRLYRRLAMKYYWSRMRKDIFRYVETCDVCQKIKHSTQKPVGLLKPLPTPRRPYHTVTMDLITGLPNSGGFTAIWVVTCKATKHVQAVPTHNDLNKVGFAKLFVEHVICKFGMPQVIVSDRDGRWLNDFWKDVVTHLQAKMAYSTARHPQTDGQTERMNQTLEVAMRAYVSRARNDWAEWLPFIVHAYNTTPQSSTTFAPYFLLYGFVPDGPADYISGSGPSVGRPSNIDRTAEAFLEEMENYRSMAQDAMTLAAAKQAKAHDKRRRTEELKPGDEVLVNPHSLQLVDVTGTGAKLVQRHLGPFLIQAKVAEDVYDLSIPDTYPMNTVINAEHLKKYHRSPPEFGPRSSLANPRDVLIPSKEYEVNRIVSHKWDSKNNRMKYLIRWEGYNPSHDSWQTREDLRNARDVLKEYVKSISNPSSRLLSDAKVKAHVSSSISFLSN